MYIVYLEAAIIAILLVKVILDLIKIKNYKILTKKLTEKIQSLASEFDSEKDFKYMHQIISFEINNCIDTEMLMISEQRQNKLLKDEELNNFVSVICSSVLEKLSENYKDKLIIKYFKNKDKLIKYITEYTYNISLKLFSKINKEKIKKIKKSDNIKNVLEENNKILKKGKDI